MTSMGKILARKFEPSRIVCWRDRQNERYDEFDTLESALGEQKIEVKNNELAVHYRI